MSRENTTLYDVMNDTMDELEGPVYEPHNKPVSLSRSKPARNVRMVWDWMPFLILLLSTILFISVMILLTEPALNRGGI